MEFTPIIHYSKQDKNFVLQALTFVFFLRTSVNQINLFTFGLSSVVLMQPKLRIYILFFLLNSAKLKQVYLCSHFVVSSTQLKLVQFDRRSKLVQTETKVSAVRRSQSQQSFTHSSIGEGNSDGMCVERIAHSFGYRLLARLPMFFA